MQPHLAVVRALYLGDLLCAIPALRALRSGHPDARISLIGLPWATELRDRFEAYIDDVLEFPGWYGIPERGYDAARMAEFDAALSAEGFTLALQMHGSGAYVNGFVRRLPARERAGFVEDGADRPFDHCLPYPLGLREPERLLRLAAALGCPDLRPDLEFSLTAEDHAEAAGLIEAAGLVDGRYVCLHPGSRGEDRRWPAAAFADVAALLLRHGWQVVVTGAEAERPVTREVRERAGAALVDLTGRTSLGGLGALLSRLRLLVCNDTGISHIAAALCVPSVVVFTGSDPARWAPLDSSRHLALGSGRADGASTAGALPTVPEIADAALRQLVIAA